MAKFTRHDPRNKKSNRHKKMSLHKGDRERYLDEVKKQKINPQQWVAKSDYDEDGGERGWATNM